MHHEADKNSMNSCQRPKGRQKVSKMGSGNQESSLGTTPLFVPDAKLSRYATGPGRWGSEPPKSLKVTFLNRGILGPVVCGGKW